MIEKLKNPFKYLPLRQTICWGIVALILTAVYCWQVGLRMTSITQVNYAGGSLWDATLRQIIVWLLFAVVLYAVGAAVSRSKVRFWEVASFNLFARIPFDLILLIFAVPAVRSITGLMMDGSVASAMNYSLVLIGISVVTTVGAVWYFYWSYKAFAESTNVRNWLGVATFALCYIIAYIASGFALKFI